MDGVISLNTDSESAISNLYENVCQFHEHILKTKPNNANLRDLIAATALVISNWIQIVNFSTRVTVKSDG